MARIKIDYGIDLGTTNSAIARMENGEATIKQKAGQRDTIASCVAYNRRGALVGDQAYSAYRSEKEAALSKDVDQNAFIEFKRTMGTDKAYRTSYIDNDLSSEDLSAEILKTLKSFITDENFSSIVITIPAAFKNNQIDATRRAGKLAGFDHIEVLQEPVAAATAYGLTAKNKNGFWLVFDFGGGTFDSALIKVEEGIMKVLDTEGDNHLGGKNLDFSIVDEIIIPYIQENYNIGNLLSNEKSKNNYRNALKSFAEELKNELSYNETYNLYKEEGKCGIDDDGEEIEIDITISQSDLEKVLSPVFQKAIDVTQELLKRNNLDGNTLDTLILVGGPTLSPIVREMLEKQICKPDTSANPMTVVATGAALYASTIDVSEEIREQGRDKTKIQLEISNSSTTVELDQWVPVKILEDKTEGEIPTKVFAEITRGDNAWSSGKVEINTTGEVIEIKLLEDRTNAFNVILFDDKGNILDCEPSSFNIIQGIDGIDKMQTLSYNWGIEIKQKTNGKIVFSQIANLTKNKSVPVIGKKEKLKTQNQIRPGTDDYIKIPLFQGEHESDGTRAIYNEHVYDIIISGNDLPSLLPANSEVDLTFKVDKSQNLSVEAFFPYLEHTSEINIPTDKVQSIETKWLQNEIKKAKGSISELKEDGAHSNNTKLENAGSEVERLESLLENNKNDEENKSEVLTNLRKSLKVIDELTERTEWPKLEEEIKEEFYRLEKVNKELGNDKSTQIVNQFRNEVEEVIQTKDVKLGTDLFDRIHSFFFDMTRIYQLMGLIKELNRDFDSLKWKDTGRARTLVNDGITIINENPSLEELQPIVNEVLDLLPEGSKPSGDDTVLVG